MAVNNVTDNSRAVVMTYFTVDSRGENNTVLIT